MKSAPAPLAFQWDWGKDEHIRLHRALMREVAATGPARVVRWVVLLVVGVAVLTAFYQFVLGNSTLLARGLPWLMIIALWWAIFTYLLPRSSARAYLKFHKGQQRLALNADCVESGCDVCSNQLRWDVFQRAVETREFFLLFYTSQCAIYLPKRVLSSAEEMNRVRAFLQAHVPGEIALGEHHT